MKKEKEYSDQSLRQLFSQLPREELSPAFNQEVMKRIFQEKSIRQRRNQWIIWGATSLSSLSIIGLCILLFRYLSIDLSKYFQGIFQFPSLPESSWSPYIFIGGVAMLLLFLDNFVRKSLLKHKFTDRMP